VPSTSFTHLTITELLMLVAVFDSSSSLEELRPPAAAMAFGTSNKTPTTMEGNAEPPAIREYMLPSTPMARAPTAEETLVCEIC
jgi:hypothetical protein